MWVANESLITVPFITTQWGIATVCGSLKSAIFLSFVFAFIFSYALHNQQMKLWHNTSLQRLDYAYYIYKKGYCHIRYILLVCFPPSLYMGCRNPLHHLICSVRPTFWPHLYKSSFFPTPLLAKSRQHRVVLVGRLHWCVKLTRVCTFLRFVFFWHCLKSKMSTFFFLHFGARKHSISDIGQQRNRTSRRANQSFTAFHR